MRVVSEPASGSVTAKACKPQLARRHARQVLALEGVAGVPEQDAHDVDLRVGRPGVGPAAVHLFQHDARLREPHAAAAVLGRESWSTATPRG